LIYQDLPEGAKLEEIYRENSENKSRIIYEKGEENSADPSVLSRVIDEMKIECPADSYGLILFSHGSGWVPENLFTTPRSVISDQDKDNNNYRWMELSDFADAIPDSSFDFIILEACLMGGVEVAYELKDKARYLLVSPAEIVSPGFKNVYKTSIDKLYLSEPDLISFMDDLVIVIEQSTFKSVTLSLIRTSALQNLAEWIRQNTNPIEYPSINDIQVFDRRNNHLYFDFEQHFSRLTDSEEAKKELSNLLEECMVYKYHTPGFLTSYSGFEILYYSGLTTYINQEKFPYLNSEYKKTKWAQAIKN
jgi:hypothetical protein